MICTTKLLCILSLASFGFAGTDKLGGGWGPQDPDETYRKDVKWKSVLDGLGRTAIKSKVQDVFVGLNITLDFEIAIASNISVESSNEMQILGLAMTPSIKTQKEQGVCLGMLEGLSTQAQAKQLQAGSGECVGLSEECRDALKAIRDSSFDRPACHPPADFDSDKCDEDFDEWMYTSRSTKFTSGKPKLYTEFSTPEKQSSNASVADLETLSRKVWVVLVNDFEKIDPNGPQPEKTITCLVATKDENAGENDKENENKDNKENENKENDQQTGSGNGNNNKEGAATQASATNAVSIAVFLAGALTLAIGA